jgi:hypothetical protein
LLELRDVAIQTAFLLASTFRETEPPHGLPRRVARAMTSFIRYALSFVNLLYLPAYSPDLNPIEKMGSKVKTIL